MKNAILFCLFIFFIGMLSVQINAQNKIVKDYVVNKEFWLKVPIPFDSECKIMVSDEGIYSPKDYCEYIYDLDNLPVSNGNKVKILSFKRKRKSIEIKFGKIDEEVFTKIYLKSKTDEDLDNLFKSIFSDKAVEEIDDSSCEEGISKMQLFQCWGFPTSITKRGKREIYRYGLEFGNKIQGFDIATVEIKANFVTSISGIM